MKSHCLGPQILSDYAFLHYNYKYDWLRPTLEEIVDATTAQWAFHGEEPEPLSDRGAAGGGGRALITQTLLSEA